jgi:glycerol-3-phosphate O-acyltransferase
MDHFEKLAQSVQKGAIPPDLAEVIYSFFTSYGKAVQENGYSIASLQPVLQNFIALVEEQLAHPYSFPLYHHRITYPFDYYNFGLDLLRPVVDFSKSKVLGLEHAAAMETALAAGDNVILLANHQTEPDPQAISLLLEKTHPRLAEEMIFIAGHRVTSDPLAAPFSKGRNLVCIFSKRHLDHSPEKKQEKLLYNQRAMKRVAELLAEGGKCIYVAPSGGRDRINDKGEIEVARFDPQSIEMFCLIAQQAGRPAHFYPLTLATYNLLPPPNSIEKKLGEDRHTLCTPIHLAFGKEVDIHNFPGSNVENKKLKRQVRADYIWKQVTDDYALLTNPPSEPS